MSASDTVRRLFSGRPAAPATDPSRRGFFRRFGGASLAALAGGGLLAPREAQAATEEARAADAAWAEVEERARRFGIVPGTVVDAQGRPMASMGNDDYVGEIYLVPYTGFAPRGTFACEGQTLPIQSNQALFSILGFTYGSNGAQNFKLPDLRGRAVVGAGQGGGLSYYPLGAATGTETVTLNQAQLPSHTHTVQVPVSSAAGTTADPAGAYLAASAAGTPAYAADAPGGTMGGFNTGATGGTTAVDLRQPFLGLRYCIVSQGVFPQRP